MNIGGAILGPPSLPPRPKGGSAPSGLPRGSASALAMTLLGISALRLAALELTLDWKVGKESVIFKESIRARGSSLSAVVTTSIGEYDSVSLDERRSTTEWRRVFESEGTDLSAERRGPKVRIRGSYRGEPYDRTHDFGDLPWYQLQEISYEELFRVGAESSSFWTIDRRTLKPTLFKARRKVREPIEVMGASIAAIKYDLTVSGVPALFFTSHFWLRESDGRFLMLDVPPIFNLPRSHVHLIGESPSEEDS